MMATGVFALVLVLSVGACVGCLIAWLAIAIHIRRLNRRLAAQDEQLALLMRNQTRLPQRIVESAKRRAG